MEKLDFRAWLLNEIADFGFDRKEKPFDKNAGNLPIYNFPLDYIRKILRTNKVGGKVADEGFLSGVQWGHGFGAVKVSFTPFGGLRTSIRRESVDVQGKPIWICKKVIEITDYHMKYPDALIMQIMDEVKEVVQNNIEVGVTNFQNLESLTKRLATYLERKTTQRILMYEGIREIKPDREYIIHWGCAGMGRQRQDQKRLDQFQIVVKYDEETGMIHIVAQEIGSHLQSYDWRIEPAEFMEYFSPSQEVSEICESILVHLNSY